MASAIPTTKELLVEVCSHQIKTMLKRELASPPTAREKKYDFLFNILFILFSFLFSNYTNIFPIRINLIKNSTKKDLRSNFDTFPVK